MEKTYVYLIFKYINTSTYTVSWCWCARTCARERMFWRMYVCICVGVCYLCVYVQHACLHSCMCEIPSPTQRHLTECSAKLMFTCKYECRCSRCMVWNVMSVNGYLHVFFELQALATDLIVLLTDVCESSPCKNGGTCSQRLGLYQCQCVPGSTGINCETGSLRRNAVIPTYPRY